MLKRLILIVISKYVVVAQTCVYIYIYIINGLYLFTYDGVRRSFSLVSVTNETDNVSKRPFVYYI